MLTFNWSVKLSDLIYEWLLTPSGSDGAEAFQTYTQIYGNTPVGAHGMEIALFTLLLTTLIFPAIYYFVVSSDITKATWKNYFIVLIIGYVVLVGGTIGWIGSAANQSVMDGMMIKLLLFDIVYYLLLYGVHSLWMKSMSKAGNIHLFGVFNRN